jgi:hypothetical protein
VRPDHTKRATTRWRPQAQRKATTRWRLHLTRLKKGDHSVAPTIHPRRVITRWHPLDQSEGDHSVAPYPSYEGDHSVAPANRQKRPLGGAINIRCVRRVRHHHLSDRLVSLGLTPPLGGGRDDHSVAPKHPQRPLGGTVRRNDGGSCYTQAWTPPQY